VARPGTDLCGAAIAVRAAFGVSTEFLDRGGVALAALEEDWGEDFCRAVYAAEFGDGRDIGAAGAVADVLTTLGRDAQAVLQRAQSDAIKTRLRRQTEEAQRLGIFGAPSFVTVDGELFWGNDRLEAALAWAGR
jgi:2-hydroxychromene-2-carboxylate isomerase